MCNLMLEILLITQDISGKVTDMHQENSIATCFQA